MFSFISVSASCSFLKYLGTVQERDHRQKREFFYIQAPTVLKPGTWTNRRLIIRIRIYQPPPQALRFPQVEASDWWWTAARDHGKGTDRRRGSPLSPSRLPLRSHVHRERDVWVRGSRYTLQMLVEWLVLDYSLSVRYLDTKNVHIKVFILDSILKIVSNYSASSSEFVIAFVSWNAGKVPDFSTSDKGTKGRLTSR